MDQLTQQNAALVEEVAAAAASLNDQTAHLMQAVSVFELAARAHAAARGAVVRRRGLRAGRQRRVGGLEVVGRRRRHVGARHRPSAVLHSNQPRGCRKRAAKRSICRASGGGRRAAVRRERAQILGLRPDPLRAVDARALRVERRADAARLRIDAVLLREHECARQRRGLREPRAGRIDQIEPFELMAELNRLSAAPSGSSATQPVAASTNVRSTACAVRASASSNAVNGRRREPRFGQVHQRILQRPAAG